MVGGSLSLSLSHTHTHTPPLGAGDGGLCFVSQCRREVLPCSTCHPPASWKMERSFIQQYMEITYLKNLQYKSLDASEICQDEKKKKVRKGMEIMCLGNGRASQMMGVQGTSNDSEKGG